MNDTTDPEPEPNAVTATATDKKQRSPVERAIVWSMIGILLVVAAIEAHGRLSYGATLSRLQAVVERAEQGTGYLTLREVRESIAGFPSEATVESRPLTATIRLSWFSLLRSYEMDLQIEPDSKNPMFLGYSTPDAPLPDGWASSASSQFVDAAAADAASQIARTLSK